VKDGSLSYMGVNQYSRKWSRLSTYGGKLVENVCQAIARDVMADAMPSIEAAGYAITLTVHDEILTETPDTDNFSEAKLSEFMSRVPEWATGLPLAAKGFEAYRYKK
jgi:DNA polymerase